VLTNQQREESVWVRRFAPLVRSGGHVLDLAAGSGRHTRLLLDMGLWVTAVDRDIAALKELAGKMSTQAMESMKDAAMVAAANAAAAPQAPAQGAANVGLGKEGDRKLK